VYCSSRAGLRRSTVLTEGAPRGGSSLDGLRKQWQRTSEHSAAPSAPQALAIVCVEAKQHLSAPRAERGRAAFLHATGQNGTRGPRPPAFSWTGRVVWHGRGGAALGRSAGAWTRGGVVPSRWRRRAVMFGRFEGPGARAAAATPERSVAPARRSGPYAPTLGCKRVSNWLSFRNEFAFAPAASVTDCARQPTIANRVRSGLGAWSGMEGAGRRLDTVPGPGRVMCLRGGVGAQ
jgi:hypothetical protein